MSLSAESLQKLAATTGYRAEILEKVDRLIDLLNALFQDPYLKARLALKGGTALNLFYFELPRLSVDIDLNYIGTINRDIMQTERPEIEQRIQAIAARQNLNLRRAPGSHAGCKWSFRHASALGGNATLEVDLNYMYRQPLWPVQRLDSRQIGPLQARNIPVLDIHELAGGKLAALFSRTAARDLFDAHHLLTGIPTNPQRLRLAFVLYGAMSQRDWRAVTPDDIQIDFTEARRQLFPLLIQQGTTRQEQQQAHLERTSRETRQALGKLLPLNEREQAFLDQLREHGKLRPSLLGIEDSLAAQLEQHPALLWRTSQIRRR